MDDYFSSLIGIVLLSLIIILVTVGMLFAIPAGIAAAIIYAVYLNHYGPAAQNKRVAQETQALYEEAAALVPLSYTDFMNSVVKEISDERLLELAGSLFEAEGFLPPEPPPPNSNSIEGGRYRDQLHKFIAANHAPERVQRFVATVMETLRPLDNPAAKGNFVAERPRTAEEIEALILAFFGDHDFFKPLRQRLDQNFKAQKGTYPTEYTGKNCAWDYLRDTPLLPLETIHTFADWQHPESHTLVMAGSGAGKTTLFKHLIADLLRQDVCVIVMDSQSQLIEELAHIELGEDELTWITPDHPLALNPFYADKHELADEAFVNNAIGQLEFVIDKLLDAPMVPRQRTLFHHCTNLVLRVPDSGIETFFAVLDDPYDFATVIDALDATSQEFFFERLRQSDKKGINYESTKSELRYRLDALLRNPTLRRIFNTTENTFSMFDEMDERKLVLIDTSQALLAAESATFGRFMIAQALQACYRRVKDGNTRRPVVFFIDEAHEYFDEKLETMLLQARKANVGLVIATQDLARASRAGIADTMLGSTTTKIASRLGAGDARRLAPLMKTGSDYLHNLPEYSFAFASGSTPALTIRANPKALDSLPRRSDLNRLRKEMTEYYGPEQVSENASGKSRDVASTSRKTNAQEAMSQNDRDDITPSPKL